MGQNESSLPLINFAAITKDEIVELIMNLNERCQKCFAESSVKMMFALKKLDDKKALFWKSSVRICCYTNRNQENYCKNYTLYEFLKFYRNLCQILDANEATTTTDLATDDNLMQMSIFQDCCSVEGQCIICFDGKPNAVLPCAHAYCEKCVHAFRGANQQFCPLCRYRLDGTGEDSWVVTEKPEKESINLYLANTPSETSTKEI